MKVIKELLSPIPKMSTKVKGGNCPMSRFAKIWEGLAENKHREAMGLAVFTFIALVAKANSKTGIVYLKQGKLAKESNVSRITIRRDIDKLILAGYIVETRRAWGLEILIKNWKAVKARAKALSDVTVPGDDHSSVSKLKKTAVSNDHPDGSTVDHPDGSYPLVNTVPAQSIIQSSIQIIPSAFTKKRAVKCPNPLGHKDCIEDINSIQDAYSKKFINYAKQIGSYHQIIRAGFDDTQVQFCLDRLVEDRFYQEKGWDVSTILSLLSKGGKYVQN